MNTRLAFYTRRCLFGLTSGNYVENLRHEKYILCLFYTCHMDSSSGLSINFHIASMTDSLLFRINEQHRNQLFFIQFFLHPVRLKRNIFLHFIALAFTIVPFWIFVYSTKKCLGENFNVCEKRICVNSHYGIKFIIHTCNLPVHRADW